MISLSRFMGFRCAVLLALMALLSIVCPVNAQNMVALGYNNGTANYGVSLGYGLGQGVLFTAPDDNWTLSQVSVCGKLNRTGTPLFVLEVWDLNMRTLYRTTDLTNTYYGNNFTWSVIDIPDLKVPRNFTICIFGDQNPYIGLSLINGSLGRSFEAGRNPNRIVPWDIDFPHNRSEWLIDAVGYSYSPPPIVELTSSPSGKGMTLKVKATAAAHGRDLNLALFRIIDSNGDAVWSEQKQLNGSKDEAQITWSGQSLKISNMTESATPVYAYNPLRASSAIEPFDAYTAQAMLRINPAGPEITVSALFSNDGNLHALVDSSGNFYYISPELIKVIRPDISYATYIEKDLRLVEFRSTLTFIKYNEADGLIRLKTLLLDRAPIQHFGIKLEKIDAPAGIHHGQVAVVDLAGNTVLKLAKG